MKRITLAVITLLFFILVEPVSAAETNGSTAVLGFALVLTLAAVIGKQICALGVVERGINRLAVGLGMIPRGEVGLIFAGIGATLMLPKTPALVNLSSTRQLLAQWLSWLSLLR